MPGKDFLRDLGIETEQTPQREPLRPGSRVEGPALGPGEVVEVLPATPTRPGGLVVVRHDDDPDTPATWDARGLRHADGRRVSELPLFDAGPTDDDPRPDLAEDSHLWPAVLAAARRIGPELANPGDLHGLLHGLRCGGCRLERRRDGSLLLRYAALREAWPEEELRGNWLEPYKAQITQVFRVARQAVEHGRGERTA